MLAQDGLFIHVAKNVKAERAIQVVNILRSDVDLMVNRRVLIVMDEGAEAKASCSVTIPLTTATSWVRR